MSYITLKFFLVNLQAADHNLKKIKSSEKYKWLKNSLRIMGHPVGYINSCLVWQSWVYLLETIVWKGEVSLLTLGYPWAYNIIKINELI